MHLETNVSQQLAQLRVTMVDNPSHFHFFRALRHVSFSQHAQTHRHTRLLKQMHTKERVREKESKILFSAMTHFMAA